MEIKKLIQMFLNLLKRILVVTFSVLFFKNSSRDLFTISYVF